LNNLKELCRELHELFSGVQVMSTYKPRPIDTTKVTLSDVQRALVEKLAANAHEVWAEKRVEDGWRYGGSRNDEDKTHPCLVPYDALPESEKEYDRVLVEQVLRAVVALGYRIDPQ
jgi:RyR domain